MEGHILCRAQYPGVVGVIARGQPAWTWGYRVGEPGHPCNSGARLQRHRRHLPRGLLGSSGISKTLWLCPALPSRCPWFRPARRDAFPTRLPGAAAQGRYTPPGHDYRSSGPEVDSALERMEVYCGERWWETVISADICPKPDPRALRLAIEATGVKGGLYIGDTADDLDLVMHYQAGKKDNEPDMLAAMIVFEDEVATYQQRGADFVIRSVVDVLDCLIDR